MQQIKIDPYKPVDLAVLKYLAADLTLRVIALMKARQSRRALVRVIQLNALCRDYPALVASHPSLLVFVRFGKHFCARTKRAKMRALFLLCQTARDALAALIDESVLSLVTDTATPNAVAVGAPICDLQTAIPKVLAAGVKPVDKALKYKERVGRGQRRPELISADDTYVLNYAGAQRIKELGPGQSGLVRAAIALSKSELSETARRACCVDYGILTVMKTYKIMTEALLVGIARHDDLGNQRSAADVTDHAKAILAVRNKFRVRAGLDSIAVIGPPVYTQDHVYHMVFDARFVNSDEIQVKHFEFYRTPGAPPVEFSNSTQTV